ncbi:kinesin motor domain-containing protein [Favolaschia claudopus]|uniref:Kinesin-like protein n=1 Tax=Favolaschia claudopus TaxID=2862362 RepID=A0AAW0B4N2_9AGAR
MATRRPPSSRAKAPPPQPRARSALAQNKDDAETNIQVVVRTRRRSDREIADNSPIIVSANGAKSKELTIEAALPHSSLGVVTLPPVRTYPVVMGYNCTLFAYGQTGTGKTYTMQGDLTPTPLGNPSTNAGMIPRVLFRLFHHLESSGSDYSVKVSYIELKRSTYGHGKDNAAAKASEGLKIFDDASKNGVFIQGLEEVAVKDSADALALLTKGSERRQIAATKFNDHSSRSHSVFSITVHVKEAGHVASDDLLKIGKLNLVDLAGSENIGRSGAENKRAREAGMINQSLLTLGRVINALVDKAQHVPYRESKLTRLLQDSLGGRTKTCIIATVSPARSNMEETLSTLDYAMRAKSIRNKPELNQRMTRNSLLKEYVAEIERLKADVLAAREKNGIFFSEETWQQLSAEHEVRQTELEEARKQVDIVEGQMRNSIALLKKREGELKETRDQLKKTEEVLDSKTVELKHVQGALEEETVVRSAPSTDGGSPEYCCAWAQNCTTLFDKLGKFRSASRTFSAPTPKECSRTEKQYPLSTIALSRKLESFLETTNGGDPGKGHCEAEALAAVQHALNETQENFRLGIAAWSGTLRQNCDMACSQANEVGMEVFGVVENAVNAMASIIQNVVKEACAMVDATRGSAAEAKELAADTATAELTRLRYQNELLTKLLDEEKLRGERAKDELLQRVSGLLGDFTKERDRGLREAVGIVQTANVKAEEGIRAFEQAHGAITETMEVKAKEGVKEIQKRNGEAKRTRDGAIKSLSSSKARLGSELSSLPAMVSGSIDSYSKEVQMQMQTMNTTCGFDRQASAKRARIETTTAWTLQRGFGALSRNRTVWLDGSRRSGSRTMQSTNLASITDTYHKISKGELTSLTNATKALAEHGARSETSTGTTPKKRVWQYLATTGVSTAGSDTFLAEHRPLPDLEEEENAMLGVESESPAMVSLASSASSSQAIPVAKKTGGGSRPVVIPLLDTRNVYTTRRSRR